MAATYEPIASTTTSSSATSVTFSGIAADWTDLVVVYLGQESSNWHLYLRVGNSSIDTGTNYSVTQMWGSGVAAGSARASSQSQIQMQSGDPSQLGIARAHIMSYANTNVYKTVLVESTANYPARHVGLWRSTAAIDTVEVLTTSGYFVDGAVVSLYGIKASA